MGEIAKSTQEENVSIAVESINDDASTAEITVDSQTACSESSVPVASGSLSDNGCPDLTSKDPNIESISTSDNLGKQSTNNLTEEEQVLLQVISEPIKRKRGRPLKVKTKRGNYVRKPKGK